MGVGEGPAPVPHTRDELGTVRYRKSLKVGTVTEYTRFDTVRYRYLRVKIGKYRYRTGIIPDRYRTGTKNVKSEYRIGTEKAPGSVNPVPVPGLICSSYPTPPPRSG
ncbi:hypothetical protein Hanom_Chr17g01537561 [Helianthus anomalus]